MLAEVGEHCRKTPYGSLRRTQRSVAVAWSSWGQDSWKRLMSVHGRSMSRCRSLAPLSCWCSDSRNGWRCSRRRRDAASGTRCWTVSRLTTRSSTPGARIACATTSLAAACGETTWNRGEGRRRRLHSEWILNEVEWKKWEWRCKGWITIGNFHLFIIWFAIGERIVCEIDSFIINKKKQVWRDRRIC